MLIDSISKMLKLDGLIESIKKYIETRIEILKIEIQEDVAKAIAHGLIFLLMGTGLVLFIFFMSLATAMLLGEYLGFFWGFTIVAGAHLIVALLLFLFRKPLIAKIDENVLSGFKSRGK
jgi:hypothetical protein